jgi:UDP-glucose 4-epimerase
VVKHGPYKKAVILGSAGFIGINLAHALTARGFDLICFDRAISPHWPASARHMAGEFAAMPTDLMNVLDEALVFHLISSCRPSASTAEAANEVNYDLTTTIRYLESCKSRALRWVFVSSGGTVYGHNDEQRINETAQTHPICSYGVVKLAIEQYFSLYRHLHNTDYVVARLANPYGPWQRPLSGQGLIATLIYKALKNDPIEVWGSGENVRDYIYISDAVEGLIAAAAAESGNIYNVGTGIGTSITELTQIISAVLNIQIQTDYRESRSVDVKRNVLNADKLLKVSSWKPANDLTAGILKTAAWIKSMIPVE